MRGLVIRNTGSWYSVRTDDDALVECKIKGNFRLKGIRSTNPVAVGDIVDIVTNSEGTAFITRIHDRRNCIVRRSQNLSKQSHVIAANIDQAFLIATIDHPVTSTTFIDRFLATAEAYSVPAIIVFNKSDLLDEEQRERQTHLISIYNDIGYRCIETSAVTGFGLDAIRNAMQGRISLLSGNSGVGKSTIINALLPGVNLRTAEISRANNTGAHTTTFSEMLPLDGGGYLIDTPGIKGFGSYDMQPEELTSYFPEIFRAAKRCRFSNCTHTHEPDCAVQTAVEQGIIAASRFQSYLSMLLDKDESKYREPF